MSPAFQAENSPDFSFEAEFISRIGTEELRVLEIYVSSKLNRGRLPIGSDEFLLVNSYPKRVGGASWNYYQQQLC